MSFLAELDTLTLTKTSPTGLPMDLSFSFSGGTLAVEAKKNPKIKNPGATKKKSRRKRVEQGPEVDAILQAFFLSPLEAILLEKSAATAAAAAAGSTEGVNEVARHSPAIILCASSSSDPVCPHHHLHPESPRVGERVSEDDDAGEVSLALTSEERLRVDVEGDDDEREGFVHPSARLTGKGKAKVTAPEEHEHEQEEPPVNPAVLPAGETTETFPTFVDYDFSDFYYPSYDDWASGFSDYDDDDDSDYCANYTLGDEEDYELFDFKQRGGVVARTSRRYKQEKINPDRYVNSRDQSRQGALESYLAYVYEAVKLNRRVALAKELSLVNQRRLAGRLGGRTIHPFSQRGHHQPPQRSRGWAASPQQQQQQGQDINSAELMRMARVYGVTPQIMDQIQKLQWKPDLTPEDYELLLMLDQAVKPKTVSRSNVNNLAKRKLAADDIAKLEGACCPICMGVYAVGESVKTLPCGHIFHDNCIEYWLLNSSTKCPSDGLPIFD